MKSNDEVYEIVKKHLTTICTEVDPAKIKPEVSMADLGATSLDIVEVVSCSMRELKVRVPRSELSKLKNIGGLVELLRRQTEAAAAPAPTQP
ncbi:MAG: phosphopantetheine-binding protein [Myxococcota bacterium]